MISVSSILNRKGNQVVTVSPETTVLEALKIMAEKNIGSVVVTQNGNYLGIVTERDILRALASGKDDLQHLQVSEIMTTKVVTGRINSHVPDIMGLMTEHRIRHLPIVEEGRLVGLISIGDVVKAQHDEVTTENHYLKEYIQS